MASALNPSTAATASKATAKSKKSSFTTNLNDGEEGATTAIAIPPVIVKSSLMPRKQLEDVIELSKRVYEVMSKNDGTLWRDAAKLLKHDLDKGEKPGAASWHVICGTSFGAYITYEVDQMAYLNIGHIDILLFKQA